MRRPLAIDVGEWFHDPALRAHVSPRHWRRLASCGEVAFARAAAQRGQLGGATWFVTAALATTHAARLQELVAAGDEVALAAAPIALAGDAPAAERERAQTTWLAALATVESATGVAVRGVLLPWPVAGEPWWCAWFAAAGLRYVAVPADDDAAELVVRPLPGGAPVAADVLHAFALVPERPRLVGLPPTVFAAHYDGHGPGRQWSVGTAPGEHGGLAVALGIASTPATPRSVDTASRRDPKPRTDVPRLAVVVPLKDEAAGIASLAVELATVAQSLADAAALEFVFVDDGSSDDTWLLLQQHFAPWPGATFVRHERNRGVAAAIRSGLLATDAPLCASIDGDLSYDPMELRAMLPLAVAGADVVTASPYHCAGGVKNVPGWRLLLSRTLSAAYRLLLRSPVRTWTSCFRIYRRSAVAELPLTNEGFLGTAELLVRVMRRGGRVVEHPCVLEARLFGFSKMKVLRTILGHLRLLAAVALRRVR